MRPRHPLSITPDEFEQFVEKRLRRQARKAKLKSWAVLGKEMLDGSDGDYEIDIVVRFELFAADLTVVVECKRHKNRIKRELVQVLYDKCRSVGARKCMMFATSGYQRGAIEYASNNGVALMHVKSGSTTVLTRSENGPPPEGAPDFAAWRIIATENGHLESLLGVDSPDVIADILCDA